jgi:hypothetical protein
MYGPKHICSQKAQPHGKQKKMENVVVLVHQQKNLGSFNLCQYVHLYVVHQPKAF